MSAIEAILRQPAAQAIGWALLHFLWQGALVGLLTAIALVFLRRSAADVRYVVSAVALSLMLTLPAVTAVQLWHPSGDRSAAAGISGVPAADSAATPERVSVPVGQRNISGAALKASRRVSLDSWLPVIVLAWLCGVGLLSLRLVSGWVWVQRMKTHGAHPAREGWQVIAARLARRLHITRGVTLLESRHVDVPTVIGWIRPVILLPMSALSGLTPHQLEAILAHELAHVRRHDYVVNLVQTLVETLLFYHPAVWWVSRQIRLERENCCDDLAVRLCGDPFLYAQALADLEQRRGGRPELALAATGGSLLQRVRRLIGAPTTHSGRAPGWLAGGVSVLVILGITIGAVQTNAFAPAPPKPGVQSHAGVTQLDARRTYDRMFRELHRSVVQFRGLLELGRARFVPQIPPLPPLPPSPPEPPATSESPVSPEPPAPSAPAVPPPELSFQPTGRTHVTITSNHHGQRLEVRLDGDVEFTDDDTDVKRLTPGGLLRIKDDGFLSGLVGGRAVELSADANGNMTRRFRVGSSERPFEPEGRQWLAQVLPGFIRQSGIGAPARVARILKSRGGAGVLEEISLIEGSWAKRVYFSELLKTPLDAAAARQALVQAGREIDSDFELATLLIQASDTLLVDDATRQAYFDAGRTIQSDFEMHRVYSAALKRGPVGAPLLAALLNASLSIDSDFEEATLLIEAATLQPLDDTTRAPFFRAVDSIGSAFERGRVLQALARRADASPDTVVALLRSTAGVTSDFEASNVLLAVAATHSLSGPVREAYIDVAQRLGDFEQGKTMSALVRSERRK